MKKIIAIVIVLLVLTFIAVREKMIYLELNLIQAVIELFDKVPFLIVADIVSIIILIIIAIKIKK